MALCASLNSFAGDEIAADTNDDWKTIFLKTGSMVLVAAGGGYLADRFWWERERIAAATVVGIVAVAYFNIYSTLAAVGPAYCVMAAPYFGTCPCCPPGCFLIMAPIMGC